MDLATVMSVIQVLFAALQCAEIRKIFRLFGFKPELDKLISTVRTVKAVLADAEAKQDAAQPLSKQEELYVDELKTVIYEADDLFDEFKTIVDQQKERHNGSEIRRFFSRFEQLGFARKMSKSAGKIRKKLDGIATNYGQFAFKVDYEPIKARREETCSYVDAGEFIGRENDVENLVGMLSSFDRGCNFVTIVGIGGLGKTALAQLVYNDERVTSRFSLRIWVCVSDQYSNEFGVKDILLKILRHVTCYGCDCDDYTMDHVQMELVKHLRMHKYLLVLDDVWTENREQWLNLERFLKCGKEGSSVVVTTRSKETGRIIGNSMVHELEGLSLEHSRHLFKTMAFGESNPPEDLVEIGHQIVDKCANVPLAIRVVGSLLYCQTKNKWLFFQEKGLAYISDSENGIIPILKLSYRHLKPQLKSCFSFCAVFPKDFDINKEMLKRLWMAQGYVVPFGDGQSMEDAAEECFSVLLRRCFFQDVRRRHHVSTEIVSCKMHDLMHDIAQDVAGKEICEGSSIATSERVRHIAWLADENFVRMSPVVSQIRTCFQIGGKDEELLAGLILAKCVRLRSLTLNNLTVTSLPESLGSLVHLRYLDLSVNTKLERLPKSIPQLHNLLTLNLSNCCALKELPKNLSKLHKLQVLDIAGCNNLKCLPSGISKLANLHTLHRYIVGGEISNEKECFDHMEELKGLCNLKGSIEIRVQVPKNAKYDKKDDRGGAYVRSKEHLNYILFSIKHVEKYESAEYEEALLEELQPHSNLKGLRMEGCKGGRLPSWMRNENLASCLPKLVNLVIRSCEGLQSIPNLRGLSRLKELWLWDLPELEYVENEKLTAVEDCEQLLTFPCLEHVYLRNMPKLKAWWQCSMEMSHLGGCLPRVKRIQIYACPELKSNLSRPLLEGVLCWE